MWKIDKILNFLKTGEWYSLQEVIDVCLLPECNMRIVLKFLDQFDFIQMNESEQKVRLTSQMLSFLNQTDD
jgi:hypothetical protein